MAWKLRFSLQESLFKGPRKVQKAGFYEVKPPNQSSQVLPNPSPSSPNLSQTGIPPIIGSQKGALEKGALKSVFWAINAAFYFDFAFISSSNGRHSSISFGYCVIINNRGCVLDPFPIRLAHLLRKASFVFLMITKHPHSFESCACAVLGKPGGMGSGDNLAGLLHWTGISVTGSGFAGNIMTSAGPDDNFGRQFWRQFSLMKI